MKRLTLKPRAKWLNDILLNKVCEKHASVKKPSRSQEKNKHKKQIMLDLDSDK